jgi:hypothetical protein
MQVGPGQAASRPQALDRAAVTAQDGGQVINALISDN